ncbi:F-box/FBD/LRR-repeat protein [Cardamine amara subsp. amara]|uniref:F-box/FBD/LRR-repeat protein n=1 Tax=Cardamine amara subsp. amara TaxID=228776 RepID=A0ABD1AIN9_CARAN
MGGRKKKTKVCDKVPVEDRISQLPDSVIAEILCHISTKDAVRTSVLSTRWRNLWESVPELDISSYRFSSDVNSFVSFAERFFDPHMKSWVRKLRLSMSKSPDDKSFLNRWIDAVSTRRIQHLDLRLYHFNSSDSILPLSIYTCQTLVHLQLHHAILVNAEVVSLPCLKIIHLEETTCPNEATLEKLISGSPLLEDLTLIRFSKHIAKVLQVRSQTLKRIRINESSAKVVIDAPLLQCLRTVIHSTKNFEIINLGFSTKLDINVLYGHGTTYRTSLIHGILTDISRVRDLDINHYFWKEIFPYSKSGPVPQFGNLSHLNSRFFVTDLEMLPTLLESCPKLESLTLELIDPYMGSKTKKEPKVIFLTVPECLVSSLKLVAFKRSIPGNEGEIELLRYLLKNSTILEKLKLDVYYTKKAECDFLKELLTMPRCSSTCEIHCSFIRKRYW